MRFKRFVYGTLIVALGLIAGLCLSELGIRVIYPVSQWTAFDAREDWRADPQLGWSHKAFWESSRITDGGRIVRFRTNEDGLVPGESKRERSGNGRILIFGDSTVLGRALPEAERLHSVLSQTLSGSSQPVEVYNAGVQGYSTDQSYLLMKRLLPLYRPDVVVFGFCSNDFEGNGLSFLHGFAKPRFVLEKGKLVPVPVPIPKQPPKFRRAGMGIWQHSALFQMLKFRLLTSSLSHWVGSEELVRGVDSQLYFRNEVLESLDFALLGELLNKMKDLSAEYGAQFVFYSHPDMLEVWDPVIDQVVKEFRVQRENYDRFALEKELLQLSEKRNLAFVPMIDFFLAHQESGPFHLLPRDPHMNREGYRLTAIHLSEYLRKKGA